MNTFEDMAYDRVPFSQVNELTNQQLIHLVSKTLERWRRERQETGDFDGSQMSLIVSHLREGYRD
jgi:hypothetical protein